MAADEGFVIGKTTYPFPTAFRLCDPVLVSQVTGMSWAEFVDLLEDPEQKDPAAMAGMVAVAVWQQHPKWPRDRVRAFVEQLDMESVDVVGAGPDADDPPMAGEQAVSGSSPAESSQKPESLSVVTSIPASTGVSGSATTSPLSTLSG